MAKQFRLDQFRRNRAAIYRDESFVGPAAVLMKRRGHQLFPSPRLAGKKHGQVGRRDAADLFHYFYESMTATHQVDIGIMCAAAPAPGQPLRPVDELLTQRGRQRLQFLGAERFQQIVISSKSRRVQRAGGTAMAGHQNYFGVRHLGLKAPQYREAVRAAQHHVAKNYGPPGVAQHLKRIFGGRGSTHYPTLAGKHGADKVAHLLLVINYQRV